MIRAAACLMLLSTPLEAEPLRIGAAPNYPPFLMVAGETRSGFDAALMDEICARGSYECNWTYMPLNALFSALNEGRIDVATGGIGYSTARDRTVDFTCVYIVNEDPYGSYYGRSEIDPSAATIAVTAQSLYDQAMQKAGYATRPYADEQSAITAVMRGEADLYFGSPHMLREVKGADSVLILLGTHPTASSGPALVVAQGNRRLTEALNRHLAAMSAEGQLAALQSEWMNVNQGDIIADCFDTRLQS